MWPFKKREPKKLEQLKEELAEVEDALWGLEKVFGWVGRARVSDLARFERLHVEKRQLLRKIEAEEMTKCTQA
jgi:hypothetical protein